jgi:hypothetical protein
MLERLVSDAITEFQEVARLTQLDALLDQIRRQILAKPHKARTLPLGHTATYAFLLDGRALNGVDPQAWLADVLARTNDHKIKELAALPPWRWAADQQAKKVAA